MAAAAAHPESIEGEFTATPQNADQMMRRLYSGVWKVGKEVGAKLDGAKDLPKGNQIPGQLRAGRSYGDVGVW